MPVRCSGFLSVSLGTIGVVKTVYYTATSVDGYIADANNSLDWLFQIEGGDGEENPLDTFDAFLATVGAIAMGSTTYQWILDHHVNADADRPQSWAYPQPTWVFSSRELPPVAGADLRFVRGDVADVHTRMAEVAGDRVGWIVGGGDLVGQFHDRGLLDEVVLDVAPVTLGAGAPLLPRTITAPGMTLLEARRHGPFARLSYRVHRAAG